MEEVKSNSMSTGWLDAPIAWYIVRNLNENSLNRTKLAKLTTVINKITYMGIDETWPGEITATNQSCKNHNLSSSLGTLTRNTT